MRSGRRNKKYLADVTVVYEDLQERGKIRYLVKGVCIKEFVEKDLVNKGFVDNVFIIKKLVDEEFINEELFNGVFMVYFDKRFGEGEFLDEESQFFGLLFARGHVLQTHHSLPSGRVCLNVE